MRYNNIIIEFAFSKQPYFETNFIVRAPDGFYFDEDCLGGIVTHPDHIMGPDFGWPDPSEQTYTMWPELAEAYIDVWLSQRGVRGAEGLVGWLPKFRKVPTTFAASSKPIFSINTLLNYQNA